MTTTSDYAALAQRLRARAQFDREDAATYGPLIAVAVRDGDARQVEGR